MCVGTTGVQFRGNEEEAKSMCSAGALRRKWPDFGPVATVLHRKKQVMYKRFSKQVKRTNEDSSSDEDSYEEQETLDNVASGSESESESGSQESEDVEMPTKKKEDENAVLFEEDITMEELEAGDEAVKTKPKRGQVMLYECSICPEKRLASLNEVKEHIVSKVRTRLERGTAKSAKNSASDFLTALLLIVNSVSPISHVIPHCCAAYSST